MARGWESKSVESQTEARAELIAARRAREARKPDPGQIERERKRDALLLHLKRVQGDIERCRDERYRKTLTDGMKYLEEQLKQLDSTGR